MAKRLQYDIAVDPSKGIAGLKQFSSAVKRSMREVDDSMDDSATSAQKLAKALSGLATDLETEMKGAAKAADALGKALGPELSGRADIDSVVADLNRMGLTFDEITADADVLAASLRQLDQVQMSGPTKGLQQMEDSTKRANTGVQEFGKSADSSGSALANMVGNSAQDLGALGGIAGSTGVAIGQIAEYATDAAIAGEGLGSVLRNFGAVLGPIAAIGAGIAFASSVFGDLRQEAEASKQRVQEFADAMSAAGDDTVALTSVLRQSTADMDQFLGHAESTMGLIGEFFGRELLGKIPLIGGAFRDVGIDIADVATRAEVSMRDFAKSTEGNIIQNQQLEASLLAARDAGKITGEEYRLLTQWLHGYQLEVKNAKAFQEDFNVGLAEANDILQDTLMQRGPLKRYTDQWNVLMRDMRDGTLDTEAAAASIRFLSNELGIPPPDVISIALDEINRKAEETSQVFDDTAGSLEDWADRTIKAFEDANEAAIDLDDAQRSINEMATGFGVMARNKDAITKAFDIGNRPLDALGAVIDVQDAIRDLGTFIRDEGVPNVFDPNDIDAGPFLDKIAALRTPIQEAVANAFATGGPAAATATADAYVTQIVESMRGKLSADQVRTLLGLDDLTATLTIAVDQASLKAAQDTLEVLTGLTGRTPWSAEIELALASGQLSPAAANVLIARELEGVGVDVPASLLPPDEASKRDAVAEANRWAAQPGHQVGLQANVNDPKIQSLIEARQTGEDWADDHPIRWPVEVKRPSMTSGWFADLFDAGGTAPRSGGIAGEIGPEILRLPGGRRALATHPTYVPPGTRVTSRKRTARILRHGGGRGLRRFDAGGVVPMGNSTINVNFHGVGAIGNRYDVMRVVTRAGRDAARLLGTRA